MMTEYSIFPLDIVCRLILLIVLDFFEKKINKKAYAQIGYTNFLVFRIDVSAVFVM